MRREIWSRLRSTIVRIALKDFTGILNLRFAQCAQSIIAETVRMITYAFLVQMISWSPLMKTNANPESKTPTAPSNSDNSLKASQNKLTPGFATNAKTAMSLTPNKEDAFHVQLVTVLSAPLMESAINALVVLCQMLEVPRAASTRFLTA